MSKAKLDLPTLMTVVAAAVLLAAAATYIARLGASAEQDLPGFFAQLRWILLGTAAIAFIVAVLLAKRLDQLAAQTESQRRYPPDGIAALPSGVSEPCAGEPALMVAARLRGISLLVLCLGVGAGLSGLLFAFRL
ncbi:MAG TPA: hypothetical protein VN581_05285 [Patescibacteria group bacterium]|nr:hypothetical protein [Patescibacteria group bacterium]